MTGARYRRVITAAAAATATAGGSLVAPPVATARVADLVSSRDNTLFESDTGSLSSGAGEAFFAGRTAQFSDSMRVGLIAFDLQAGLPSNAVVNSAALTLTSIRALSTSTVALHALEQDWGEGDSDAGTNGGGGAAAQTGDATWLHRFYPSTFWTTPGGDYADTSSAAASMNLGPASFGPTPQLNADVQNWIANPAANFGWAVVGSSTAGSAKRIASRENPDEVARPTLHVDYSASRWQVTSGAWSNAASWAFGLPDGIGAEAGFTHVVAGDPQAPVAVSVDGPRTVATLLFDTLNPHTLAGSAITLNGPAALNRIEVANGSHVIAAPLVLAAPAKIDMGENAGLKLAGAVSGGKIAELTLAATAKLDVTDNALIIANGLLGTFTGSAYDGISGLIDAGRGSTGNAQWDGAAGITTSDPRAVDTGNRATLGVATAGQLGRDTFRGVSVTATDVILMLTWGGDANLDGKINIDDYGRIDSNVAVPGANGWFNGDFNYDGRINIDDYGIIDSNISNQGGVVFPTGSGGIITSPTMHPPAAVPEPTTLSLLALTPLLARRPRRALS